MIMKKFLSNGNYNSEKINIYGNPQADLIILRLVGEHEENIDIEVETLSNKVKVEAWGYITIPVNDWFYEMTPWENVDDNEKASGGADKKLRYILDEILAAFEEQYSNINRKYVLVGYSLAGLFSLWASYQTEKFEVIVAASPSVWYPKWTDYILCNKCKASRVYLSLGNKEHKTRNKLMSDVSKNISIQKEALDNQKIENILEWNEGNHFNDVAGRILKGIIWGMSKNIT